MTEDLKTIEGIELEVLFHQREEKLMGQLDELIDQHLEKIEGRHLRHQRKMARIEKDNETRHVLIGVTVVTLSIAALLFGATWLARANNSESHARELDRTEAVETCIEAGNDPFHCTEAINP